MKYLISLPLLIGLLFAATPAALPAGEGNADDAVLAQKPFLGVEVSPVSRALRHHLELEDEVGLTVSYVVPGSSAEKAGLERYDILVYFNDQLIINNSQFSALLRRSSPGDPFRLKVLRKGEEVALEGSMGSRLDQKRARESDNAGLDRALEKLEHIEVERVMGVASDAYEKAMEAINEAKVEFMEDEEWREHLRHAQDVIRERVRHIEVPRAPRAPRPPDGPGSVMSLGNSNIVLNDDEGTLILKTEQGNMSLTAIDSEGRLLFTGPLNTEEERGRVPAPVLERLSKMEIIRIDADGTFEVKEMEVVVPEGDADISYFFSTPTAPTAPVPALPAPKAAPAPVPVPVPAPEAAPTPASTADRV